MLQKIGFQPGINKQITATAAEGQWIDCDNVRFRYSTPEKIGGWKQLGADNVSGAARSLHQFTNSSGQKYSIIGTNRVLYAWCIESEVSYGVISMDTLFFLKR